MATSVLGSYTKAELPLLVMRDTSDLLPFDGLDISANGMTLVFHGSMTNEYTNDGKRLRKRKLYHFRRSRSQELIRTTSSTLLNAERPYRGDDLENSNPDSQLQKTTRSPKSSFVDL